MTHDSNHYQDLPVPVGAMSKDYPDKHVLPEHRHARGQLIHAVSGIMEIACKDKVWLVPPQRAVWMPPGVEHRMRARGKVSLHTLFIRPDACPAHFADQPRSIPVSGLLRELLLRATAMPTDYDVHGRDGRVIALLLDELDGASEGPLPLPAAQDQRLARVCEAILADTGVDRSLEEWGRLVGASSRTLARLFQAELGVSFRSWRQQARVLAAIPRLAAGVPVTVVAADLGYETPGAFSAMFRKLTGVKPSHYFKGGSAAAVRPVRR